LTEDGNVEITGRDFARGLQRCDPKHAGVAMTTKIYPRGALMARSTIKT
jgi:hypothetical protein